MAASGLLRATVAIDGTTVTLLPRRAPVGNSGPIRGRPLTVFPVGTGPDAGAGTAVGPPADVDAGPPAAPSAAADRLRAALPRPDAQVCAAVLQPGDASGVAVFDLTADEALAVVRALNCTRVLHWDGRRAHLLP